MHRRKASAMKNILIFLYLFSYTIIVSFSFAVFMILKPFSYIDNVNSYIVCDNESRFDIGPNFIYSFEDKLDEFNDGKARKLCEFNLIKDYGKSLKTAKKLNYVFYPVYKQESSIQNSFLGFIITLLFGILAIEIMAKILTGWTRLGTWLTKLLISLIY